MNDDVTCDVAPSYIVFNDTTFMFKLLVVGEERALIMYFT